MLKSNKNTDKLSSLLVSSNFNKSFNNLTLVISNINCILVV